MKEFCYQLCPRHSQVYEEAEGCPDCRAGLPSRRLAHRPCHRPVAVQWDFCRRHQVAFPEGQDCPACRERPQYNPTVLEAIENFADKHPVYFGLLAVPAALFGVGLIVLLVAIALALLGADDSRTVHVYHHKDPW